MPAVKVGKLLRTYYLLLTTYYLLLTTTYYLRPAVEIGQLLPVGRGQAALVDGNLQRATLPQLGVDQELVT